MYNFIVNLFSEEDYHSLLETTQGKHQNNKILVVSHRYNENNLKEYESICVTYKELSEIIDEVSFLCNYSKRKELLKFLKPVKFINPTNNKSNNIGGSNALLSHSPTHFKITDAFIKNNDKNNVSETSQEASILKFSTKKIEEFKKGIEKTEYYSKFPKLIEQVITFFENFSNEGYNLTKNDYIIFLVDEDDITEYINIFERYVNDKILKYKSYEGECSACKKKDQLYALTQGNNFDLGKDRKYLLRNPTRYKTNLKSNSSENYNICKTCAMKLYYFFEYLKSYEFYRYVFPTQINLFNQEDYKNYSRDPSGILKILKKLYEKNNFREFDYVMVLIDFNLKNIEFTYISNFNYRIISQYPAINIQNTSLYSSIKNLGNKEEFSITDKRNKSIFLSDLNLLFNNTLIPCLFETDSKKLKSLPKYVQQNLHPFIKQKILEYNSIIRNYIFYQDDSLFAYKNYSKLFIEFLSEIIENNNLRAKLEIRDDKLSYDKIKQFLLIYYKYLNNEPNGGIYLNKYKVLEEKMKNITNIEIENDFEASYLMGQLFRYLLNYSKTIKNRLDLFTKYTLNVHNMEYLKKRLLDVLEKYSYNEYIDNNAKFQIIMKSILAYEFSESYETNKIPLYTGYFDNNYLYGSKKEKEIMEEEKKEVE